MLLSEFKVDHTYVATKTDFVPPDGAEVVPGGQIRFTVLEPATRENSWVNNGGKMEQPSNTELTGWSNFLRVKNHRSGKVHLLHPESLSSAEDITGSPGATALH